MPAPIFDRDQATSPSASATRRRLPLLVLASLLVVGAVAGTGVALATRPSAALPAVAAAGTSTSSSTSGDTSISGDTTGAVARTQPSSPTAEPADRGPASVDTARNAAVLPDGTHHAYIRRVDIDRDRITVDVVQLFLDGDAVKAAVADGKSRQEAQYLMVWLRNQNPRLRTLPLAADLRVDFHHSCEESSDRRAVLTKLAASARLGVYFYSLTVHDGAVHAIKERQIIPAC
jgi:hypothetical protein